MSEVLWAHPMEVRIPKERIAGEYLNVHIDRCPDSAWQFRLNLHRETRIGPGGEVAPTVAEPFQTLALLQRPEPLMDLEVFGVHLPAEIEPADWLDLWVERHGLVVRSRKPVVTERGVFGDVVCTWETPEGPFAGRLAAMRWGSRLFFLAQRTPAANYAATADDFFLALATFLPVEAGGRLTGEEMQTIEVETPVRATVKLPVSYAVEVDRAQAGATVYSGDQDPLPALPDDPAFGRLNLLVVEPGMADHPAKAAGLYINGLLTNPVTLHGDEFNEEAVVPAPFGQSWLMVSGATLTPPGREAIECEMRCRVLYHGRCWVIAGVLGPSRAAAPIAWMRNKRALEVVTSTVEVASD